MLLHKEEKTMADAPWCPQLLIDKRMLLPDNAQKRCKIMALKLPARSSLGCDN
jgi:hypothetical protein